MIEISSITVRYPGQPRVAVDNVSLNAPRSRVTAVVGPNGSGKSSLIRALLGRVPLESGTIKVDGEDVRTLKPRELAMRVAVVTQREESIFARSVREYIALGRYASAASGAAGERKAVEAAATRAEVNGLLDRKTDELSGGEWQRVRIARALAQGASALVLDEPTSFLDIAHEMQVFELVRALATDGVAVLLVSHQLNLVARFADWMVLLQNGSVAASGEPDTVMVSSLLERVYEWPLVVSRDPAINAPALVPLRRPG